MIGKGEDITYLKMPDDAPAGAILLTNRDHQAGNEGIYVKGITFDWNKDRQGGLRAQGGIQSSCVTFANTKYLWIKNCNSINAGLHGFDITAPSYNHDVPKSLITQHRDVNTSG